MSIPSQDGLPVTERLNELCTRLDGTLNATEFFTTIRSADAQIYGGYRNFSGLLSPEQCSSVESVAAAAGNVLRAGGVVVMTGCGTSGRVAFLTARRYHAISKGAIRYLCAGGDSALLLSDELPEDDPKLGAEELAKCLNIEILPNGERRVTNNRKPVFLIGVTCGISAPYVIGQVASLLDRSCDPNSLDGVALMGFNPASLARKVQVKNCYPNDGRTASCFDVAMDIESRRTRFRQTARCWLLNPVIGPEPVAGSSRMKGGSATAVMLDVLCLRALQAASFVPNALPWASFAAAPVLHQLTVYHNTAAETYHQAAVLKKMNTIAAVMVAAGEALSAGGKLYFIGAEGAGVMGFVDLAEMPDTYGSPFHESRGFVSGGWPAVANVWGVKNQSQSSCEVPNVSHDGACDLSFVSNLHRISLGQFSEDIIEKELRVQTKEQNANVCVVALVSDTDVAADVASGNPSSVVGINSEVFQTINALAQHNVTVCALCVTSTEINRKLLADLLENKQPHILRSDKIRASVEVFLPRERFPSVGCATYAMKIMTNAVSTYAQARGRGALYQGRMISAGPANDKIFMRCVKMIAEQVPTLVAMTNREQAEAVAEESLIRAIHKVDDPREGTRLRLQVPRATHIQAATLPPDQRHKPQLALPVAFLLAAGWKYDAAEKAALEERQLSALLSRALSPKQLPDQSKAVALTIDVGGTNVRAAVVTSLGKMVTTVHRRTYDSGHSPKEVLQTIAAVMNAAFQEYTNSTNSSALIEKHGPVGLVAVGQPGHIFNDGSIGRLAAFPNWGKEMVPLKKEILNYLDAHSSQHQVSQENVFVFDDANSAAMGEAWFGMSRLAATSVTLTLGTGIGSALVTVTRNGEHSRPNVHRGARGLIELGHAFVPYPKTTSAMCSCGQLGCLETLCSGKAIADRGSAAENMSLTTQQVFQRAKSGSKASAEVVETAVDAFAYGCINAIRAYDPDIIVISGSDKLAKELVPKVRRRIQQLQWKLHNDVADVPLSRSMCNEPGVLGAAALGFTAMKNHLIEHPDRGYTLRRATEEADLLGLYNVCLKTGDSGNDGTHLFSDKNLLGSIFVGPYVVLSQQFAFCLEAPDGSQAGYTLGVLDTVAFNKLCEKSWWPKLVQKFSKDGPVYSTLRPNEKKLVHDMIFGEDRPSLSPHVLRQYPSHLHIDLLGPAQNFGFGTVMINRLICALAGAGSVGVHLVMAKVNKRAFYFYTKKFGFEQLADFGDDIILGKKLVAAQQSTSKL